MSEDIQELGEDLPQACAAVPQKSKEKSFLSPQLVEARRKNPTVIHSDDQKGPCIMVAKMRRTETFQAKEIHGADINNKRPAQGGLISTAEKRCPTKILVDCVSNSKKFCKKVFLGFVKLP